MDNFLKLKLEMVYRGLPVEEARTRFGELKGANIPTAKPVKRKLRFPAAKK
jgi:hypothetical protein